jgi:hypothetical protein
MRYFNIIMTIACILFVPHFDKVHANTFFSEKDSVSSDLNEALCMLTDRNLYVAGEKVLFSAFVVKSPSMGEYDWSKVLYLELIGVNGNPLVQAKYPISDFRSDGYLLLPRDILTGNYYLKAYTRWMRNFSSASYTWVLIKVINPFRKEIENAGKASEGKKEHNAIPVGADVRKTGISCLTDKKVYHQRDKVTLNLSVSSGFRQMPGQYCITVVSPDAIDTMNYGVNYLSSDSNIMNFPLKYIPDIRGLSLSGNVIEKYSGQGVSQAHVRLSMLDKNADYSSYITEDKGSFLFAQEPYYGTTDMYVAVDPKEDRTLEILVDKEYANDNITFFDKPFQLSEKEKMAASEMMLNYQISKSFFGDVIDTSKIGDRRIRRFFYGTPSNTISIDDYIELPTIGEVIFELVPEVFFIKRNDVYYLRSRSYITDLEVYKPLILIDNIPVSDIGAMLSMSPERIERIDVVDRIYAKGDLLFGGILNLISRKGDLAGIDLPKNSYFFSFDGFVQPDTMSFSRMTNRIPDDRVPDVRNCLYWNPSVHIAPGNTMKVEFYTTDRTGNYLIVIRGATEEGTIIEGNVAFDVVSSFNLDAKNE